MQEPNQSQLEQLAMQLSASLLERNERLATAESCTGGWVAMVLTSLAGSSQWFERGFVTYSNEAKIELLGVRPQTLHLHGAVSEPVVIEMLQGTLHHSHADWALTISGIAGPTGGSPDKPVGTICFAWGKKNAIVHTQTKRWLGSRQQVRAHAVEHALQQLINQIKTNKNTV